MSKRIGVKITQNDKGEIIKEETHEVPAEVHLEEIPFTTNKGMSEMTKEILRKLKENK